MRDDDDPNLKDPEAKPDVPGVSRRDFLKISGMSIALPLVADSKTGDGSRPASRGPWPG